MDEFPLHTENEALRDIIAERCVREEGISFRDFMELALYHPQHGYYCSPGPKMGKAGDYLTSPEVSPIFAAMVGRQLRQMWEAMGRPKRFEVVEAGAGSGALARDLLAWAGRNATNFRSALVYRIVERSEELVTQQRRALSGENFSEKVSWQVDLPRAGINGCILSNELLDSLPVHRVFLKEGALLEVFVAWDGSSFREELRALSSVDCKEYFERLGQLPGEGCYAEVNLEAPRWFGQAAAALEKGFLLTFDYGYEANDLFASWRKEGTLLCFYRHTTNSDPFARLGFQDMTSHVDFSTLARSALGAGLDALGLASQADFLSNLGITDALRPFGEASFPADEYIARRQAVAALIDPLGLGRIRAMAHCKGLPLAVLDGFRKRDEELPNAVL